VTVEVKTMPNALYYGDNLDVLKRHIPDASVDLVYLDPPFQSGRDYNVLFEEHELRHKFKHLRTHGLGISGPFWPLTKSLERKVV
jgi:hypothetical protein